jgi:hypothetical protein
LKKKRKTKAPAPQTAQDLAALAAVTANSPGKEGDGLRRISPLPYDLDRDPQQISEDFSTALDAWRTNPIGRRIVTLVTAYVTGDGITLQSSYNPLQKFISAFWSHPQNHMPTRQREWCDELTRTGELFIVLHTNPADGMSYVRAISAGAIDKIETEPGDYETELSYHETVPIDDPDYKDGGRTWFSPNSESATPALAPERSAGASVNNPQSAIPLMLHFAINRPVGAVRGESDLAPILSWLRRYNRWLEDRVRLNAAARAFLWIVKVPPQMVAAKTEEYRRQPEAGTVIVAENGAEQWEAIGPKLEARDAMLDGRAIRWMIAAGGPGTSLVDFGEAEEANLATAKAMAEQRQKIMRGKQHLFAHILATVLLTAYNRAATMGVFRGRQCTADDLEISLPDISPTDNNDLATAAFNMSNAFRTLSDAGAAAGPTFTEIANRLVLRFAGETITEEELAAIVRETQEAAEAQSTAVDATPAASPSSGSAPEVDNPEPPPVTR